MRPDRSALALARRLLRPAFAGAVSLALHALLVSPFLVMLWLDRAADVETPGDAGTDDGPTGNDGGEVALGEVTPISVSVYEEQPVAAPVPALVTPTPAPGPPAATKAARPTTQGTADGDAETQTDPTAARVGAQGHKPRGDPKPCDAIAEIATLGEQQWRVERSVVDWYATHIKELEKQAGVSTHRGEDGKPDGIRLFLPRCSVLRQAGIHHADIVNSINGRRIATLPEAIAAYLILRDNPALDVALTRKNGEKLVFHYTLVK